MMKLLYAAPSPFVRKVFVTAHIKGVMDRITLVATDTNMPTNAVLRAANPVAKIPTLVLEDGTSLYDSGVICEYLDTLTPEHPLFAASGIERYRLLTRAALADGIMDAALLIVYEGRFRPADKRVEAWVDRQQAKVEAGLAELEAQLLKKDVRPLDYSHVTCACALGYLDLRFEGAWRTSHPALVAWLDQFARDVPSYGAVIPAG